MKRLNLKNKCRLTFNSLLVTVILFLLLGIHPNSMGQLPEKNKRVSDTLPLSVKVVKLHGILTTVIHDKNGHILILNDSLTRSIIHQAFFNGRKVFTFVEQMPQFPGGTSALKKYLHDHIRYPEEAKRNGIQRTVVVQFIVRTDGSLSNINTVGIPKGDSLEEEAKYVISKMPDWIPGMQSGKKVSVQYSLPVRFVLDSRENTEQKMPLPPPIPKDKANSSDRRTSKCS